jgi:hypothetical protein
LIGIEVNLAVAGENRCLEGEVGDAFLVGDDGVVVLLVLVFIDLRGIGEAGTGEGEGGG